MKSQQPLFVLVWAVLVPVLQASAQPPQAVSQTSYRPAGPAVALPDLGLDRLALFGHRRWADAVAGTPVYMPDQGAVVIDDCEMPSGESPEYGYYDDADCCYPPPPWSHRCSVYVDYLYLRPRDAEIVYAAPVDGPVGPGGLGNPIGPLGMLDPDYESAFRVGFWWARDDTTSWGASYTRFSSSVESSIEAEPRDFVQPLVTHPGVGSAADNWQQANARLDVDFELLDADFRWLLAYGDCYAVNLLAGGRLGRLQQDFGASFVNLGTRSLAVRSDFDGAGLQLGLDAARYAPQSGWMAYGRGLVSLLAGHVKADYVQASSFADKEIRTNWEAGRVVPMLDLEMGIGWRSRCDRLRLSVGYLYTAWLNTLAIDQWIDGVRANDFAGLGNDTLTFDGPVARAEWRF